MQNYPELTVESLEYLYEQAKLETDIMIQDLNNTIKIKES